MSATCCEDCGQPSAEIGDVVTGDELLAALEERATEDDLALRAEAGAGECLVYLLRCEPCGWQGLRSTERVHLQEFPEPIG